MRTGRYDLTLACYRSGQMSERPRPWDYENKENRNGDEVGLVCEELEKIDSRLVAHDKDGNCSGVRYEQYAGGILTAAIQALKYDNDNMHREIEQLRQANR